MSDFFSDETTDISSGLELDIDLDSLSQDLIKDPRDNPILLGHEKVEKEVLSLITKEQLPSSVIITGQKGIGKATLAFRLARYLFANDEQDLGMDSMFGSQEVSAGDNKSLEVAETNPIFSKIASGGLTDLKIIKRNYTDDKQTKLAASISIDEIRKLKDFFSLTASEGGYRIAIIDSLDEMNNNSKNAILKILEEPPEKTLIVLIAHSLTGVLDTIKSRCRVIKLSPLSEDTLKELLNKYIFGISETDVNKLISINPGSIGKAIEFYENEGLELLSNFEENLISCLKKDNTKLIKFAESVSKKEQSFLMVCDLIIDFLSKAIKYQTSSDLVNTIDDNQKRIVELLSINKEPTQLLDIRSKLIDLFERTIAVNMDKTSTIITAFNEMTKC